VEPVETLKVYVCSPYRANEYHNEYHSAFYNVQRAIHACRYVVSKGHAPYAPHLYLSKFLDDSEPGQRLTARIICFKFLVVCDELWQFGKYISDCMLEEIEYAEKLGKKIRYIDTEDMRVQL